MATTTSIPRPHVSSPLSAIQGTRAYGDGNPATVTTITYHFGQASDSLSWTPEFKADFRKALDMFEAVANIRFVETGFTASTDLVEFIVPGTFYENPNTLGSHQTPKNDPSLGIFNTEFWKPGVNGDPGGYFFTTLLHEVGHALGLAHPHDDHLGSTVLPGVTAPFDSYGVGSLNQGVYTVMSYNDGWDAVIGNLPVQTNHGGNTGLGALDVAALQAMYGANTTANSGNSTYYLPPANAAGTGYQALWDTGGNDTIRYDGGGDVRIDLRAATLDFAGTGGGVISHVVGVKGGFTIAHGVVIENATGGSGNDLLHGSTAQNVLRGNGGHDTIHSGSNGRNDNTIYGGHGNDVIYLAHGSGADQVFGEQGNDLAHVVDNNGSFAGGTGVDTVRFASAISNYLFFGNGSTYQFLNVVTHVTFTVFNDVEFIQFLNGAQQYTWSNIVSAMQLSDIETTGVTLKHANQGIYLLNAGNSDIALTRGGQVIGRDSQPGWQALQVEDFGSGFKVLWQHTNGDYAEWVINAAGQFVSHNGVGNVASLEKFYGADLNGDNQIGYTPASVEANKTTSLSYTDEGIYRINDSITLTRDGAPVGLDSQSGWRAIQVEASGDGFRVLWQHTNGDFAEWVTNAAGELVSHNGVGNIIDVESFYGADLNNDTHTGHFTTDIESAGATSLSSSSQGAYLINGSITLTRGGAPIGPDSQPGWQAIQVEALGDGFKVLWQNTSGVYAEWVTNAAGELVSHNGVNDVADVESFYGADIDGSGTVGHGLEKLSQLPPTAKVASSDGDGLVDVGWEETADVLEFVPNMTAENDPDASDLFGLGQISVAGIPAFAIQVDRALSGTAGNAAEEETRVTIANVLEEDSFLL